MTESVPPRDFAPMDPARRPRFERATVRLLVVDADDRVLLFGDSDPNVPDRSWWITPGGGIDQGESEAEAAVRELAEETGREIGGHQLVGPLARRRVTHGYSDRVLDQRDAFYIVRLPAFDVDTSGYTVEEQRTMTGWRWWSVEELRTTEQTIWPADLLDLLGVAEQDPSTWPVELPDADESSVPVT